MLSLRSISTMTGRFTAAGGSRVIQIGRAARNTRTSSAIPRSVASPAIRKVANPPGTKVYSYAEAVKLLRQGQKIDFEGLAGPQNFDEYGNVVTSLGVFRIEDNQRKVLGFLDENDFGDLLKKVRHQYQKK